MNSVYNDIVKAKKQQKKLLAVLLDPDKLSVKNTNHIISKINSNTNPTLWDSIPDYHRYYR